LRLQQTLRDNEVFAGILGHDLRNPLGTILAAAQVVQRRYEGDSEEIASLLRHIIEPSQRMARMIDQLLDFTRARVGGGIEIDPRKVDLAELSRQVVAELELANPGWLVSVEIRGPLDGTWDPDRLLQALSNIVANAGQHGAAGSPILVGLDGTDPQWVTVEVHNGGTIPEALLPHLFAPFRGARDKHVARSERSGGRRRWSSRMEDAST
jgi:two-component system, sensor histidine kinase and response regulator